MGARPNNIYIGDDLRGLEPPPGPNLYVDLPSPRAGEIPPALSPLDAFAMHSRLLARKFEVTSEDGRRISRLQHAEVEKELLNRPDYFRSASRGESRGSDSALSDVPETKESSPLSGQKVGLVSREADKDRPVSQYPMFEMAHRNQHVHKLSTQMETPLETPDEYFDAASSHSNVERQDYFGMAVPRASSPEPVDRRLVNVQAASPMNMPSLTNSVESIQSAQTPTQQRTLTNGSNRSQRSLRPPRSPAFPKSPRSIHSIRSVPLESGDEDSINGSRAVSSSRKFSSSSGMSRPQSPFSPFMPPMYRSPSTMSDYSTTGSQKRNFSRPLSSSSNRPNLQTRPSFDSRSSFEERPSTELAHRPVDSANGSSHTSSNGPSRQASGDDVPTPFKDDVATPLTYEELSVPSPFVGEEDDRPSTSYTYKTYTLPRGREVDRTSAGTIGTLTDSWIERQFQWEDHAPAGPQPEEPKPRKRSKSDVAEPITNPVTPMATAERPSQDRSRRPRASSNTNRSRSAEPRTFHKANAIHKSSPSIKTHNTDSSGKTIKATPLHERSSSAELTPDEHLELGIETHDRGQLNKSTYHLRLAAKAGLPTAMLLYALACRHGWGMRPNQEEGVMWLRKAIDSAGLHLVDVEATLAASRKSQLDPVAEAAERRKRKAQFALATYELGISYMNGWGCAKDKQLGLQCYEVAGSWGDMDALAEAGFCYTQGLGCKKDLKKAAALYRKAAGGGMSMAGNSWIYKLKYMDNESPDAAREKNAVAGAGLTNSKDASAEKSSDRTRSRARSIWSRKK